MKLPYRLGDSFALPLGDGRFVRASIERCDHHTVQLAIETASRVLQIRTYDTALVLHRWKIDGRRECAPRALVAGDPIACASVERTALGACDGDTPSLRLRVRSSRDEIERTSLRLDGPSESLGVYAGWPIAQLTLTRAASELPTMPQVERLTVHDAFDTATIARAFPNLRALRYAARGATVDIAALHALTQLRHLDLAQVASFDVEALRSLALDSLRLYRIDGVVDVAPIATMALETLALEGCRTHGLDRLQAMTRLAQFELLDAWDRSLDEVAWTLELPHLVRATIDIGGRRKNTELYKRATWAYPWPRITVGNVSVVRG